MPLFHRAPTIVVVVFLGAHLLLAHWQPFCAWGVDLLAFHPGWVQVLFLLGAVSLLWPRSRQATLDILAKYSTAFADKPWLVHLLLALAGGAAFITWPSAVHFLGDGYLYLRELPLAASQNIQRVGHEPLTFWLLNLLYRAVESFDNPAEIAGRIYSYTAGILYLLLIPCAARMLGHQRIQRALLAGFLLTPGFVQLFCGYVETYALLVPGVLLYTLSGYKFFRGELPLWAVAVLLGLLVPLHFTLVTLAPSLLVLAVLSERNPASWSTVKKTITLGLAPALSLAILLALEIDPLEYMDNLRGSHFLPLWGSLDPIELYHLLDPNHLLDFLNQQFLVAPGAVMVGALLHKRMFSLHPERIFLLSAALFPLLFTFLANPEIGAFRDWDVLALPALPLTLWAALALLDCIPEHRPLAHTGLLICGAAGLHTLIWLGLNADPNAARTRFVSALEECPLSTHARSYGWETMAIYHRERGHPTASLQAYLKAVEAMPEHPRHWISVGHLSREQGHLGQALQAYQRVLQLDPNQPEVWSKLGLIQARLGRYEESIAAYREALERRSEDAITWHNLGDALGHSGRFSEAMAAFGRAIQIEPGLVQAYFNLGITCENAGEWDRAIAAYRQVLTQNPVHLQAHNQLGGLYMERGDWQQALASLQKALEIDSTYALAHYNLVLLYDKLGQKAAMRHHGRQFLQSWKGDVEYAEQVRRLLDQ